MSVPPQGGWQPPQQPGPPSNPGQPYGQQPPPGWQQGWPQQPPPPPQKGNSLKWLLIAVAVLLVIGISVGATLIFTRGSGGGGSTTSTSAAPSDIASANDTGPVAIITDEPTCTKFVNISNSLGDVQAKGWGDERGKLGPASTWTSDQRAQVDEVSKATRAATDQVVDLAKQTPHRVVRELYQQFIAFGRAYVDRVPNYVPADDELASAIVNASSALVGICNTITFGSASRSISVDPAEAPTNRPDSEDPSNPKPFINKSDDPCASLETTSSEFDTNTAEWQQRDTSIAAAQWTPSQRALDESARPLLSSFADAMEKIGRQSGNGTFEDFAVSSALYLRAAVAVGDNYVAADSWLSFVAFRFNLLIINACHAAAG